MVIDLNCDMGESFGRFISGADEAIMPLISSANIACGFHAGDATVIHNTIRLAQKHNVAIGAHPSYPDLQGFGRREMHLDPQEVYDIILYQVGAVSAFTKAAGIPLQHVKPHGALYNRAAIDPEIAMAIVSAIFYFDKNLILFCPDQSCMMDAALKSGLRFYREAFADRTYTAQGLLTPRSAKNAQVENENFAVKQVLQLIKNKTVTAVDGTTVPMEADTVCIHGDGILAVPIATALRKALNENNIRIKSPQYPDGEKS